MEKSTLDVLGIDVGKRDLHAVLLQGKRPASKSVPNSGAGIARLQTWLKNRKIERVHVCLEATGGWSEEVAIALSEAGHVVSLVNPARIKAFANIGSEPGIMLTGPVDVTKKLLKKAGMTLADIDLIEINEAFASVVLRYMQAFDLDAEKVNVNGGAIAMGHPLGATGAMILGTVLDELERRDLSTALVTLCIGAGMGTATIIERV